MTAVRTLCARHENAVCAPWARREHDVGTSCGRCRDALRTLCSRDNGQIKYLEAYFAATPQRADRFLERCTNDVASPCGVTEALDNTRQCLLKHI